MRVARDIACLGASSLATVGVLQLLGFLPLWFGAEVRRWNRKSWDTEACALMDELENDGSGYFVYVPQQELARNFLQTGQHTNTTSSRKVRRQVYFNPVLKKLKGVVHFGSDTEGPPRCVHGGCLATVIQAMTALCASCICMSPSPSHITSTLSVDYREKTPLGSQLGLECELVGDEAVLHEGKYIRKLTLVCKVFSLKDPSRLFARGTATVFRDLDNVLAVDMFDRPSFSRL